MDNHNLTTVATELGNKAPNGFGLGSNVDLGGMQTVDSAGLDTIRVNGWVYFSDPDNLLASTFNLAIVRTDTSGRTMYQTAYPFLSNTLYRNCKLMRALMDSIGSGDAAIWSPWEWGNPPLSLGVEYRTTERHNGKPVYVKLVNVGAYPNNSQMSVSWADSGVVDMVVGTSMTGSNGALAGDLTLSGVSYTVSRTQIVILTQSDLSHITGRAYVKYTKSAD